jgi:hypothetical protein
MRRLAMILASTFIIGSCAADPETAATSTVPSPVVSTLETTTTTALTTTVPPTTTATTAPPQPSSTALPVFPPGRASLEHGADTWVVVLAGSETSDDPVLAEAILAAEEAGYATGPTDCDEGAPEALGQPGENLTVSVYLENEADARAALLAFEARGISGVVAQLRTFCLD